MFYPNRTGWETWQHARLEGKLLHEPQPVQVRPPRSHPTIPIRCRPPAGQFTRIRQSNAQTGQVASVRVPVIVEFATVLPDERFRMLTEPVKAFMLPSDRIHRQPVPGSIEEHAFAVPQWSGRRGDVRIHFSDWCCGFQVSLRFGNGFRGHGLSRSSLRPLRSARGHARRR